MPPGNFLVTFISTSTNPPSLTTSLHRPPNMSSRRLRQRKELTKPQTSSISAPTSRPRRAAAQASAAATSNALDRETDSPDEPRQEKAIKLKVGSRLREVEKPSITVGGRRNTGGSARDSFEGGEIVVGSRPRKKAIIEESSEEEEEEDVEGEEEDDAEGDEDDDAEGDEDADADADEDADMDDAPLVPSITVKVGGVSGMRTKPSVTITPAKEDRQLPGVEDQEMAMDDDDDEELSELESQEDEEGAEEDAEVEEDEEMDADGDEEEDAEGDSDEDEDDGTPASMSRSHTPDPSKLTRRQRGEFEGGLMALSNEAMKKKHLTAEEHAARRAEMARRRKNLSEKRNEEEKVCFLLHYPYIIAIYDSTIVAQTLFFTAPYCASFRIDDSNQQRRWTRSIDFSKSKLLSAGVEGRSKPTVTAQSLKISSLPRYIFALSVTLREPGSRSQTSIWLQKTSLAFSMVESKEESQLHFADAW